MVAAKKSFPVIATLVTFVAVVIMLKLGFWQLERMQEKQLRMQSLAERQQQSAISLMDLNDEKGGFADTPVSFVGSPKAEKVLLLDNRIYQGTVGYEVLAFVDTNAGTVIVNYGWIEAPATRDSLPNIAFGLGLQTYEGHVVEPSLNPMIRETQQLITDYPAVVQQLDIPLLERLTQESLLPFVVSRIPTDVEPFIRNWQPVVMPPEKHIGYAIQWFGLALAAITIYLFAVFKRKSSRD